MKKYISSILIVVLTACVSPALQSDVFIHSAPDMDKVDSECADTAANEKNTHIAAVTCRFDAYEVILGERGFQEYNDLDTLKKHFLYIAKQQDAHKLTDKKASMLFEKYTQEFYTALHQHDNVKYRVYEAQKAQTWAVIGAIASGLGNGLQAYSAARYPVNSPAYQPAPCPACDQGIQQGQDMVNNANNAPQPQSIKYPEPQQDNRTPAQAIFGTTSNGNGTMYNGQDNGTISNGNGTMYNGPGSGVLR